MIRRLLPPSLGFVGLVVVYTSVLAFFVWGFSRPDLDRVWQLHHELKIGDMTHLAAGDVRILGDAIDRHPDLAPALLDDEDMGIISAHDDGWIETPTVVILRTAESTRERIQLTVQTSEKRLPYTVVLRGPTVERTLQIDEAKTYDIDLPASSGKPELIVLELVGKGLRADPSVLGVRVEFCCDARVAVGGSR